MKKIRNNIEDCINKLQDNGKEKEIKDILVETLNKIEYNSSYFETLKEENIKYKKWESFRD